MTRFSFATRIILILMVASFSYSTFSATSSPYGFLGEAKSARAAALSGAFVSFENDASALFYNPATLYTVEDKPLRATFLKNVLDINSGNIVYVQKTENYGTLAYSTNFNSFGSFEYADENGDRTGGEFSGGDFSFGFSLSDELDENIFYGLTTKFIYVGLEGKYTTALAVDGGLFLRWSDRTNFGFSILNAGTVMKEFDVDGSGLPLDVRFGFNHAMKGLPILANFSFHHLNEEVTDFFDRFANISIGLEINFGKYIDGRLGYDNQIRRKISPEFGGGLGGFSIGLGGEFESFSLDYGLNQYGSAAFLHRLSFALNI
jgi:hypothetical protein